MEPRPAGRTPCSTGLKVRGNGADVRGTMAEADRTPHRPDASPGPTPTTTAIRPSEVARGRRQAAQRAYEDQDVVAEIASRLLLLSG